MIVSGRLTVTSVPVQIIPTPSSIGGYTIIIQNMSVNESVYLDGADVTTGIGFELLKGQTTPAIPVAPDEAIFGVTELGKTAEICYLVTKR